MTDDARSRATAALREWRERTSAHGVNAGDIGEIIDVLLPLLESSGVHHHVHHHYHVALGQKLVREGEVMTIESEGS